MVLDKFRERIQEVEDQKTQSFDPITFEQYLMWDNLKNPHSAKVNLPMVNTEGRVDNILQCPKCDSNHMHHFGIELFNREEDQKGEHITMYVPESGAWNIINVKCPNHTVDDNMGNNPSSRRTGIIISFVCEECHDIIKLNLTQHQGQTKMFWSLKHE